MLNFESLIDALIKANDSFEFEFADDVKEELLSQLDEEDKKKLIRVFNKIDRIEDEIMDVMNDICELDEKYEPSDDDVIPDKDMFSLN